ncbi:cytochrome C oxidase copper chaperone-domain-containing protein [Xylariaceae sp. AK1471]|nr:cytochrome C oxidase copper chaperone-domain-containing protein [Xylariaceae sp. AK1471]
MGISIPATLEITDSTDIPKVSRQLSTRRSYHVFIYLSSYDPPLHLFRCSTNSVASISPKAESAAPSPSANASAAASKPKPCCVCKDEKALRDDCMLFSKSNDPTSDCKPIIDQYKTCMAGFGFQI